VLSANRWWLMIYPPMQLFGSQRNGTRTLLLSEPWGDPGFPDWCSGARRSPLSEEHRALFWSFDCIEE
jgi:hypothetical protein